MQKKLIIYLIGLSLTISMSLRAAAFDVEDESSETDELRICAECESLREKDFCEATCQVLFCVAHLPYIVYDIALDSIWQNFVEITHGNFEGYIRNGRTCCNGRVKIFPCAIAAPLNQQRLNPLHQETTPTCMETFNARNSNFRDRKSVV